MTDLTFASVTELARMIAGKEVSPVDVVAAHLARIDALDGKARAFITVMRESAMSRATMRRGDDVRR